MIRRHVTFANCVSLLALFVALGGTSYAVATNSIGTRQIKNNSVRSTDVRNGSLVSADVRRGALGGRAIKESALGSVPNSSRVGGRSAAQLKVRCPAATQLNMGSCIELARRPSAPFGVARTICEGGNRRLPFPDELLGILDDSPDSFVPEGELTDQLLPPTYTGGPANVLVVLSPAGGSIGTTPNTFEGRKPFRCVATPSN